MSDQFVSVNDVRLRYRDTGGKGPVLLLTHGIGASLETWREQEAVLGKEFRVISWDLPGHGLSDFGQQPYGPDKFARVAWMFLSVLGIDRVTLAGNSLGAAISIRMAGFHPERVSSLVLLNAATLGREIPFAFKLMLMPVIGSMITRPSQRGVDMQLQAIFHPKFQVSDEIRLLVERNVFREGAQEAFVKTLKKMTRISGQHREEIECSMRVLSRVTCPLVFVHGRQDAVLPLSHSEQAHKRFPTSELHVLEDCGHTPQLEKPDELNVLLMRCLARAQQHSGACDAVAAQ